MFIIKRLDDIIEISPKSPQHAKRQIQPMQISWYSFQFFLESYFEDWGCSDVILEQLHERALRCGTEWQQRDKELQKQPTINHFHMHQEAEQCNLAFLYHDQSSVQSSYVTELNLKIKHACKKDVCNSNKTIGRPLSLNMEVPQTKGRMQWTTKEASRIFYFKRRIKSAECLLKIAVISA